MGGWTVDRQRAFIAALAATGSVKAAAHRINMSPEGAYYLRRAPGAEELAAGWAEAIDHGVQSLADIVPDVSAPVVRLHAPPRQSRVVGRRW